MQIGFVASRKCLPQRISGSVSYAACPLGPPFAGGAVLVCRAGQHPQRLGHAGASGGLVPLLVHWGAPFWCPLAANHWVCRSPSAAGGAGWGQCVPFLSPVGHGMGFCLFRRKDRSDGPHCTRSRTHLRPRAGEPLIDTTLHGCNALASCYKSYCSTQQRCLACLSCQHTKILKGCTALFSMSYYVLC